MTLLPLHTLETSGLIRLAQMEPELEYLFRHALVQEAAYDSILKADRKSLHLAVAREMERIYPERLDEFSALLAHHYREAGEIKKALKYYQGAAAHATQKFANREAEYHLGAALEICEDEKERADITRQLGMTVLALGRIEEAEKLLRASLPVYRAQKRLNDIADIYSNLSEIAWGKNEIANTLALAQEGMQEVGELPPSEAYAELIRHLANGYIFNDLLDEAEAYIYKAISIAELSGSNLALAQALVTRAMVEDHRGKSEQSILTLERAVECASHPFSISRARNNLAYMFIKLGRNIEAAKQIEYMVAYSREANSIYSELWFLAELNNIYCDLGKINEVIALTPLMMDLLKASGGKAYRIQVEGARLQSLIYLGQPEEALNDLSALCEDTRNNNDKQMFMNVSFTLAAGYSMLKDYQRAAQEIERGIQFAGIWAGASYQYYLAGLQARAADLSPAQESFARGERESESPATFTDAAARLYALTRIRAAEEKFDEALSIAEELAEKYRAVHFRWYYALTLWDAGEIALTAKNKTKAKELLQRAMNEYHEMNIPIYAGQIQKILTTIKGDL